MAIDVKKWATRLYDDVPWPEQRQFVEGAIDLIRAVIADEAAKQKRDQSDGVLGRQPQSQPPEQTADVPGFGLTYYEWNILPASVRPKVESEIARRDAEIERLKAANTVLEADVRQLSASAKEARAEVERLSRPADEQWFAVVAGDEPKCYAIYCWEDRAELYRNTHAPNGRIEKINFNPGAVAELRRELSDERNAREAAESREWKLREFVKRRYVSWCNSRVESYPFSILLTEAELDDLLATFAEEGKVQDGT